MVCVYVNTQLVLYGQFSWFLFQIFFYQRGSGVGRIYLFSAFFYLNIQLRIMWQIAPSYLGMGLFYQIPKTESNRNQTRMSRVGTISWTRITRTQPEMLESDIPDHYFGYEVENPEILESDSPGHYFRYQVEKPELISGSSGIRLRYPNYPNYTNIH